MSSFKVHLLLVSLASLLSVAFAPFPKEHPYHALNPWIEPWWEQLTKDEQKALYSHWEKMEPVAFALADLVETQKRSKQSMLGVLKAKAKYAQAIKGELLNTAKKGKGDKQGSYESQVRLNNLEERKQGLLHWALASKGAKKILLLEKINYIKRLFSGSSKKDH